MSIYKEIVTKTVIGKAKKKTTNSFDIETENKPDTILGCWVINHEFKGINSDGKVIINGSYDVNVWYSYENDHKTAVSLKKYNYSDTLSIPLKNGFILSSKDEIIVNALKQPTVVDVDIRDGKVMLKIDKEMGVEIIGDTIVKVAVEDSFDDYVEIFDTPEEKELDINIDELDDNFIKDVNK